MKYTASYAVLNDIHFPFEGACYYEALKEMKKWDNLKAIYLNGDVAEIESVSSHPKSPSAQRSLLKELEYVNSKFDQLQRMFKGVPVHYICGNHEYRIYRYIRDMAPELWGMFDEIKLFRFEDRPGWKFYDYGPTQLVKVGNTKDLYVRHEPFAGGSFHAKATAEKALVSIIYGHTHQYQQYSHKKIGTSTILTTAYSNGWLGDIKKSCFDYRGPRDNWVNGFSRIDCCEKTGNYELRFIYL